LGRHLLDDGDAAGALGDLAELGGLHERDGARAVAVLLARKVQHFLPCGRDVFDAQACYRDANVRPLPYHGRRYVRALGERLLQIWHPLSFVQAKEWNA